MNPNENNREFYGRAHNNEVKSAQYWNQQPPHQGHYNHQRPPISEHYNHQSTPNEEPLKGFQPKRKIIEETVSEYKGVENRLKDQRGPRSEFPVSNQKAKRTETPPKKDHQLSTYARDTEELFSREKDNTMNLFDLDDNDGLNAIFDKEAGKKKDVTSVKHKTEGFALDKIDKIEGNISEIVDINSEIQPENKVIKERRTEVIQSLPRKEFEEVKEEPFEEDKVDEKLEIEEEDDFRRRGGIQVQGRDRERETRIMMKEGERSLV